MLTSDPFLLPNFTFPRTISQSKLQDIWRPDDITLLASTYKSLSLRLQFWFPLSSLPIFPSLTHPFALKLFLSSLLSHFHTFHSHSHVPLFYFHPHEMDIILASLRKLVLSLRSQSLCPIVYLYLPPCSSVSTFVKQFSFLAHLIPFPPSTRTGTNPGTTVRETPVAGDPATSGSQSLGKASAGGPALAAKVSRAPGVAGCRAPVVEQGAAAVPPVVVAVQGVCALPVVATTEVDADDVAVDANADAEANADADAGVVVDGPLCFRRAAMQCVVAATPVAVTAVLCPASVVAGASAVAVAGAGDIEGACAGAGAADAANAVVACIFGAVAADVAADVAGAVAGEAACACADADSGAGACAESEAEAVPVDDEKNTVRQDGERFRTFVVT